MSPVSSYRDAESIFNHHSWNACLHREIVSRFRYSTAMTRAQFLRNVLFVEGGLLVIGIALAYFSGLWELFQFSWTPFAVIAGLVWTIPLVVVYEILDRFPFAGFREIRDFLLNTLGPVLSQMRWFEILWVSILAGLGEEILFRGLIQTQLEVLGWSKPAVWLTTSLAFGLMHPITVWYVVLTGIAGCYFSFLLDVTGERNLVVPIVTHAAYDFVAFMLVANHVSRMQRTVAETEHQTPMVDDDATGND